MDLTKKLALQALQSLDEKLNSAGKFGPITLTVGGGGAMMLQHGYSGATTDIDAVPIGEDFETIKPYMTEVAKELKIVPDWLNPYFGAFTIYLPTDAKSRYSLVYSGEILRVKCLGVEDVLLMKLMAGRSKDLPHIRHLLKLNPDLDIVSNQLEKLKALYPALAKKALDRLDDLTEEL